MKVKFRRKRVVKLPSYGMMPPVPRQGEGTSL
jgi:hypothetical protein